MIGKKIKLLEEKRISLQSQNRQTCLKQYTKALTNKENKLDYIKIKKFRSSKDNIKRMKEEATEQKIL